MKQWIAALLSAVSIAGTADAQSLWNEAINGDASSNPLAPSNAGVLTLGDNIFAGAASNAAGGDPRDYITFVVPAGMSITQLIVQSIEPDNIAWTHFDDGATSVIPDFVTGPTLLAGAHIEAATPDGTNVFGNYQTGSAALLAGPGFSGPIGPGTYTFLMQQTSQVDQAYSLNFVTVPAPGVLPTAIAALLCARRRRRITA
jgi:hypothetical protein